MNKPKHLLLKYNAQKIWTSQIEYENEGKATSTVIKKIKIQKTKQKKRT